MHHGGEHKGELMLAQRECVAVFHLEQLVVYAIEALHHAKGLLVANDGDVRIVLAYQFDGPAMIGLHVVHHQIVNGALAQDVLDILDVWNEEIYLYGVYEAHLFIGYQIRVVGNAVGQWPQAFKEVFVAVVHSHIVDVVCNLLHGIIIVFEAATLTAPPVVIVVVISSQKPCRCCCRCSGSSWR